MAELEEKFGLLFTKLRVTNSAGIVAKTVKPAVVRKAVPESILAEL